MAINYVALKAELQTDPLTYGYAAAITGGDDITLAGLLNKMRDGTDGEAAILVRRRDISPNELMEAIDTRDLKASPTVLEGSYLESVLQREQITLSDDAGVDSRTKDNLDRLITNTNGSQTRLNALARRNGSRAEQLFGIETRISTDDIATALRST